MRTPIDDRLADLEERAHGVESAARNLRVQIENVRDEIVVCLECDHERPVDQFPEGSTDCYDCLELGSVEPEEASA